ncbi:radical SAM peptide maturase, CXXX-repeat target family [Pelotomaculum isophthalicicum JI]|uniref:Radical SAM peptide maturase, CXXX-repeat target family n=1 Tax=Pelotomaculum isophthalicicum JI TaxID=947010 RepID=A0A9X4H0S7_9FIRM|nr:radical SAM peptide maturase, CXXX-repeat target family [Pelotomaculum isophthalicicum]MDF9410055.1 radical SAM peptide maturase, CXXX-repeat target family [Pelotomaculum isophthalicicum JI]
MNNNIIKMGQYPVLWNHGRAKEITFCVTEDCNLRCKYCYMTGKNKTNKMTFEIAQRAVDYILKNRDFFNEDAVIWSFIGGEPLLEIDLIDKICDYIKQQMFICEHPWFDQYRFNFSTNGLLYNTEKVQNYISKNQEHLSMGISIDGNKVKHDLQRVRVDGSGSYDDVVKNIKLWQNQLPGNYTKATFTHEDLPFVKDSIINLWNLGIDNVSANVVFENVWHEGDEIIFEKQLIELADYILEKNLWNDYSVRFFSPYIGFPLTKEDLKKNFCGTGKMLAISCKGNFLPCVRFLDISLNNKKGYTIGDVYNGINLDRLRPFLALSLESQSTQECINCDVATGCSWCTGFNYDSADSDTIYQRRTYNCKMHKANIRANKYFWKEFSKITGTASPRDKYLLSRIDLNKYLQFIMHDEVIPHCSYRNWKKTKNHMSDEILSSGLEFANKNGFIPFFLGVLRIPVYPEYAVPHNLPSNLNPSEYYLLSDRFISNYNNIIIYDNKIENKDITYSSNCILLIDVDNINKISDFITDLAESKERINLVLENIEQWTDGHIFMYKNELNKVVKLVADSSNKNKLIEINVLTDILNSKEMNNCDAGNNTFSLAPNGKFYICPAFYFDNPNNYVGTLESGIQVKNNQLLELERAPICLACDVYHCKRCKFLNKKLTSEYNTPPKIQCIISHIEREKARELQLLVNANNVVYNNNLKVRIPVYPDSESGNIRTPFRKHPDSDSGGIRTPLVGCLILQ